MDAATLQARIDSGRGKAAARIGYTFDVYRPNGASSPLATANKITSLPAAFAVKNDKAFLKVGTHKDVVWEGTFDGSIALAGDYLVNADHGTYFVAAKPDLLPIICVRCSHTFNVKRPAGHSGVGTLGYGGTTEATEVPVMTGFPGSLVYAQRGRTHEVGLPMDLPAPYFEIMLPALSGVQILASDVVEDDQEQRYVVSVAELSPLGWRLAVQLAVP